MIRYSFYYLTSIYIISAGLLLGTEDGRAWLEGLSPGGTRWMGGFLAFLVVICVLYNGLRLHAIMRGVFDPIAGRAWDPDSQLPRYRELQESIPPGRRFLAFLPMAHLLDFRRNPINVIDTDCAISPPPGMPLKGTSEEVAAYLRSLGISLIASRDSWWVPAGESRDPEAIRLWSEVFKGQNQWDVSAVYSYYLVARCVRSLTASYETSRFADHFVVIDLDRPTHRDRSRPAEAERSTPATGSMGNHDGPSHPVAYAGELTCARGRSILPATPPHGRP